MMLQFSFVFYFILIYFKIIYGFCKDINKSIYNEIENEVCQFFFSKFMFGKLLNGNSVRQLFHFMAAFSIIICV